MLKLGKGLLLFNILLFSGYVNYAQLNSLRYNLSSLEKKANILFFNESYSDAHELYQQIVTNDPSNKDAIIKLAECSRLLNDSKNAEYWYGKIVETDNSVPSDVKLHYADVLLKNGKQDSALSVMQSYYKTNAPDSLGLLKIQNLKNYTRYYQDSLAYSVQRLQINSESSDFYPVFYKEGILFLSQRTEKENIIKYKDARTNQSFYQFYYAKGKENADYENPKLVDLFKSSFHDGTLTFFDNETKVIFCKNTSTNKEGKKNLNLYYSEVRADGKGWTKEKLLPFNTNENSFSHPFYYERGNALYFVSDMPGGQGGTDIYFVKYSEGRWGKVTNAGQFINTKGDEMFPFVTTDSNLYFSSNGHLGMGGLDIFTLNLGSDDEVLNLGFPINSSFDDFGFRLSHEGNAGLLCSNRNKEGLNDDIYSVKFHTVRLEGQVLDKLKLNPLEGANIKIMDAANGTILRSTQTNSKGKYYYPIIPGRNYSISISKENYKASSVEVSCASKEISSIANRVVLDKLNKSFVSGTVIFDDVPLNNSKVVFADFSSDSIETTLTDSLGKFQCEINTDTINIFYIEKGDFKSIYALKPVKRKRKGSGVSFITIPVEEIESKDIELYYQDSSATAIAGDTIFLKNELNKELKEYNTNASGKVTANVWKLGKYSLYRKEAGELVYVMSFFPEEISSVLMNRDIEK